MKELECPRCPGVAVEASPHPSGALLFECPRCRAVCVDDADVERLLGGPLEAKAGDDLPNPFVEAEPPIDCPRCGRTMAPTAFGTVDRGLVVCHGCGTHRFEPGAFVAAQRAAKEVDGASLRTDGLELELDAVRPVARASVATRRIASDPSLHAASSEVTRKYELRPFSAAERKALGEESPDLEGARLSHEEPWSQLLAFPLVFLASSLLAATDFGGLLAMPLRIQFHELGHALIAWMGGRVAVPFPCGLTVVDDERQLGVHLLVITLAFALGYRGVVERRPFPIVLAIAMEALHVTCAFASESRLEAWILWNGCAAELWLSGLACAAFYFRMPDRWRWDFFRFLVLPFASAAFGTAFALWIRVRRGSAQAPVGSIMGTVGDGTGDLERLVNDHGRDLHSLCESYLAVGMAVMAALVALYVVRALPVLRKLLRERGVTGT